LQETSLKALDNEDKYISDTNFRGWMYTIMRNVFINNYRKVIRNQTFVDHTDNLYHLNLPQDAGSFRDIFLLTSVRKILSPFCILQAK
jgi:RNA polymerase sigma-70 factor (ECF subfamily)